MGTTIDLPVELFSDIVSYAIAVHPRPGDILCVNSLFYHVGVSALYTHLRFRSVAQVQRFATMTSPVPCLPRHIELALASSSADFYIFRYLADVFKRCSDSSAHVDGGNANVKEAGLPLDSLSLCLNSHSGNPNLYHIYQALKLVNPRRFSWLGPDPSHHFSTAIVPAATLYLFGAMREWSRLEHLTLTNISFPSEVVQAFEIDKIVNSHGASLIPMLPQLRTFYIGQATRLHPWIIAAMVFMRGQERLEKVRVVDGYKVSIWGPRVRRRDIEEAALSMRLNADLEHIKQRVHRVVKCEAKTERIVGGDRVEGELE